MAKGFNLTAEINLRGPSNIRNVVADIRRQLGTIDTAVTVKIDPQAANNANRLTTTLTRLNNVLTTTGTQSRLTAANITQLANAFNAFQNSSNNIARSLNGLPRSIGQTTQGIQRAAQQAASARTEIEEFGRQSALAVRRFTAFSLSAGIIYGLVNAVNKATKEFIEFDRQIVRLTQITGDSYEQLGGLSSTITKLSTSLGVASSDLIGVADTLAQAGLSAKETDQALKALALTAVAPSFDSLNETVEGSIALMRQFNISTKDLEKALSSINSVAAKFAVESSDIITAIQRTGGVFSAASKGVSEGTDALNEFIAVFTSVRATTRESAETIATGLRTIFTRIQRADTIEALKDYGVTLTDVQGKFVGAYRAVELLAQGLGRLDPRDLKFSQIVEELGGFRQIGKVLPLIQQFGTAQDALKTAYAGQGSLATDAAKAQAALAIQFAKTRESFVALIRDIGNSDSFKSLVSVGLTLANTFIKVAEVAKPLLPILTSIAAVKGSEALYQFGSGFIGGFGRQSTNSVGRNAGQVLSGATNQQAAATAVNNSRALSSNTNALQSLTSAVQQLNSTINNRRAGAGPQTINKGGIVRAFARGGVVPGTGNSDTVPAMLQPGEFVIRKKAVETIGANNLHAMNKYGSGGSIRVGTGKRKRFASGGRAPEPQEVITQTVRDGDSLNVQFTPKAESYNSSSRLLGIDTYELNSGPKWRRNLGAAAKQETELFYKSNQNVTKDFAEGYKRTGGGRDKYGRPFFANDDLKNKLLSKGLGYEYNGGTKETELTKEKYLELYPQNTAIVNRRNIGGLIQKFAGGGLAGLKQTAIRRLGIIDTDVLRDPNNKDKVSAAMKQLGLTDTSEYSIELAKKAAAARKAGSLLRFRAIAGAAGSGKSSIATGVGAPDDASLRKTIRSQILIPDDISRVDEIIALTSNASDKKLEAYLRNVDRAYILSSSTEEERSAVASNRDKRDTTGQGLYGRKPGTTRGATTDFALDETILRDELGSRAVTLGRKSGSYNLRRKREDELPEIVQAGGFYTGGFAPPTRGHRGALNSLLARMIKQNPKASMEDILVSVAPDLPMVAGSEGIEHAARYGIFPSDFRALLSRINFGNAMISTQDQPPGSLPKFMEVQGAGNRRRFARLRGAMAVTSGKEEGVLGKYQRAGMQVEDIPRIEDISATKVRDALFAGDDSILKEYVNPEIASILMGNRTQLRNRSLMVPILLDKIKEVVEIEKNNTNTEVDQLLASAPGGPYRNISSKLKENAPEIVAQIEQLRSQRDSMARGAFGYRAYNVLQALSSRYPELYGLDPNRKSSTSAAAQDIDRETIIKQVSEGMMGSFPATASGTPQSAMQQAILDRVQRQTATRGSGILPAPKDEVLRLIGDQVIPNDPKFGDFAGQAINNRSKNTLISKYWTSTYSDMMKPEKIASYQATRDYVIDLYNKSKGSSREQLATDTANSIAQSQMLAIVGIKGKNGLQGPLTWNLGNNVAGEPVSISATIMERVLPEKYKAVADYINEQTGNIVKNSAQMITGSDPTVQLDSQKREVLNQGNIEGGILEQLLATLGANVLDNATRTRAIDFPAGIGDVAGRVFGIDPNIPTEAKRTIDASSRAKAIEEFQRYFREINGIPEPSGDLVQQFAKGGKVDDLLVKYKDIIKSIMPAEYIGNDGFLKTPNGESYKVDIIQNKSLMGTIGRLLGVKSRAGERGTFQKVVKANLDKNKNLFTAPDYEELSAYINKWYGGSPAIGVPVGAENKLSHEAFHTIQGYLLSYYPEIMSKLESTAQSKKDKFLEIYKTSPIKDKYSIKSLFPSSGADSDYRKNLTGLASQKTRLPSAKQGINQTVESAAMDLGKIEVIPLLMSAAREFGDSRAEALLSEIFAESGLNKDFAATMPKGYFWGGKVDPLAKKYGLSQSEFEQQKKIAKFMGLSDKDFEEKLRLFAAQKQRVKGSKFAALDAVADVSVSNQRVSAEQQALTEFLQSNKFASGGPVKLFHGSNTGINDSVLKSFKEKGALSGIAQGYGQGAGFYVWSDKESAKRQAQTRIKGGLGSFVTVSGDTAGRPMVVTIEEMLDPATWDLDYELNKGSVVKWLYQNYDQVKDILAPAAGLTGIKDVIHTGQDASGDYIMSPGIRAQTAEGTRKSLYSGTASDLREGQIIGELMSRLQSANPALVSEFENQFFKSPSLASGDWPGLALKYVGSSPLKPIDIETFAKGGSVEDTVPALLTPGEFVINKKAAQNIGYSKLQKLNHADKIQGYNKGGIVGGIQKFAAGGRPEDYYSRLDYSDIGPSRGVNDRGRLYAEALAKEDPIKVDALVKQLRKQMEDAAKAAGVALSKWGKSESWAMWDVGKQLHMLQNPSESTKGRGSYRLANPLLDTQIQNEITNRHLAWEATGGKNPNTGEQLSSAALRDLGDLIVKNGAYTVDLIAAIKDQTNATQQQASVQKTFAFMGGNPTGPTGPGGQTLFPFMAGAKPNPYPSTLPSGIDYNPFLRSVRRNTRERDPGIQQRYQDVASNRFNRSIEQVANKALGLGAALAVPIESLAQFVGSTTVTGKVLSSLANSATQLSATFYNTLQAIRGFANFADSRLGQRILGSLSQSFGSANLGRFFNRQLTGTFGTSSSISGVGTAFAAGTAAAVTLTQAFINYSNAIKESRIEEAQKQQERALTKSAEALEKYAKTQDKATLDLASTFVTSAGAAALNEANARATGNRSFGIKTGTSLGAGALAGGAIGTLLAPGIGTAIGAAIGGTVAAAIAQAMDADRKTGNTAEESATLLGRSRNSILDVLNQRFTAGESSEDIMRRPEWNTQRQVLARSNAEVEAIIRGIQADASLSNDVKKARIEEALQIEASAQLRQQEQVWLKQKGLIDLDNATKAYTRSLRNMFANMDEAINRSSSILENFSASIELAEASVRGQAKIGVLRSQGANIIRNPMASSDAERAASANAAGSLFGSESETISKLLTVGPKIESAVLASIQAAQTLPGSTTDEAIAAAIRKSVRNELSGSSLPQDLSDKLGQQIAIEMEKRRKSGDDKVDFRDLEEAIPGLRDSVDALKGAQDIAVKALEDYTQKVGTFADKINTSVDLLLQASEYNRKATEIRFSGTMQLSKALGSSSDAGAINNFREATIRNQTGGPTTPESILTNINRLESRRNFQQNQLEGAKERGRTGTRDVIAFADQLSKTTRSLRDNQKALEDLASNSEAASLALEKISELQARTQAGQNIIEKYITSSTEDNYKLSAAFERLDNNMRGMLNNPLSSKNVMQSMRESDNPLLAADQAAAQDRRDTLEAFNMIAPFLGNTKEQNGLRANVLESMLKETGIGLTPMFNDVLKSLRNPENNSEMGQLIEQYKAGIKLQSDANAALAELNSNFAKNLKESSTEAFKTAINDTLVKFQEAQTKHLEKIEEILSKGTPVTTKASGGIIYRDGGGSIFQPRGTDTVPAMLTPGEFVVNRASTQKYGSVLKAINSNKYSTGGKVSYYDKGGYVSHVLKNSQPNFIGEASINETKDFRKRYYYNIEGSKTFSKNRHFDPFEIDNLLKSPDIIRVIKLTNTPSIIPLGLSQVGPEAYPIKMSSGADQRYDTFSNFINDGLSATAVAPGFYPNYKMALNGTIYEDSSPGAIAIEQVAAIPENLLKSTGKLKERYLEKGDVNPAKIKEINTKLESMLQFADPSLYEVYNQQKYLDVVSSQRAIWDREGKKVTDVGGKIDGGIFTRAKANLNNLNYEQGFTNKAVFLSANKDPIINQKISSLSRTGMPAGFDVNNYQVLTGDPSGPFGSGGYEVGNSSRSTNSLSVLPPSRVYRTSNNNIGENLDYLQNIKVDFDDLLKDNFTPNNIYSNKFQLYQETLYDISKGLIERAQFEKSILDNFWLSTLTSIGGERIDPSKISQLYVWSKRAFNGNNIRNNPRFKSAGDIGIDFPITDSKNGITENFVWSLARDISGSSFIESMKPFLDPKNYLVQENFAQEFDAPWAKNKRINVEFPFQVLKKLPIYKDGEIQEEYKGFSIDSSTFERLVDDSSINPFKISKLDYQDSAILATSVADAKSILTDRISKWINSNGGDIPTKSINLGNLDQLIRLNNTDLDIIPENNDLSRETAQARREIGGENTFYRQLAGLGVLYRKDDNKINFNDIDLDPSVIDNLKSKTDLSKAFDKRSSISQFPSYSDGFLRIKDQLVKSKVSVLQDFINQSKISDFNLLEIAPWVKNIQDQRIGDLFTAGTEIPNNLREVYLQTLKWNGSKKTADLMNATENMYPGAFKELMSLLQLGFYMNGGKTPSAAEALANEFKQLQQGYFGSQDLDKLSVFEDSRVAGKKGKQWWKALGPDWTGFAKYNLGIISRKQEVSETQNILDKASQASLSQEDAKNLVSGIQSMSLGDKSFGVVSSEETAIPKNAADLISKILDTTKIYTEGYRLDIADTIQKLSLPGGAGDPLLDNIKALLDPKSDLVNYLSFKDALLSRPVIDKKDVFVEGPMNIKPPRLSNYGDPATDYINGQNPWDMYSKYMDGANFSNMEASFNRLTKILGSDAQSFKLQSLSSIYSGPRDTFDGKKYIDPKNAGADPILGAGAYPQAYKALVGTDFRTVFDKDKAGESALQDSTKENKNVIYRSTGGTVSYYAGGGSAINFKPKGTDTVPAMLTPGEFVVNRSATQKNLPLLKAINSENYQMGGFVQYLRKGSQVFGGVGQVFLERNIPEIDFGRDRDPIEVSLGPQAEDPYAYSPSSRASASRSARKSYRAFAESPISDNEALQASNNFTRERLKRQENILKKELMAEAGPLDSIDMSTPSMMFERWNNSRNKVEGKIIAYDAARQFLAILKTAGTDTLLGKDNQETGKVTAFPINLLTPASQDAIASLFAQRELSVDTPFPYQKIGINDAIKRLEQKYGTELIQKYRDPNRISQISSSAGLIYDPDQGFIASSLNNTLLANAYAKQGKFTAPTAEAPNATGNVMYAENPNQPLPPGTYTEKPTTAYTSAKTEQTARNKPKTNATVSDEKYIKDQDFRKWIDSTGKYATIAKLISVLHNNTDVKLLKENRKYITIPISKLDQFDQNYVKGLIPDYKQSGGVIYASNGQPINFQSRGTDTVPAMLTPGEFVVNRKAAQQNMGLLQSINNGSKGYRNGGAVYLQEGGEVPDTFGIAISLFKLFKKAAGVTSDIGSEAASQEKPLGIIGGAAESMQESLELAQKLKFMREMEEVNSSIGLIGNLLGVGQGLIEIGKGASWEEKAGGLKEVTSSGLGALGDLAKLSGPMSEGLGSGPQILGTETAKSIATKLAGAAAVATIGFDLVKGWNNRPGDWNDNIGLRSIDASFGALTGSAESGGSAITGIANSYGAGIGQNTDELLSSFGAAGRSALLGTAIAGPPGAIIGGIAGSLGEIAKIMVETNSIATSAKAQAEKLSAGYYEDQLKKLQRGEIKQVDIFERPPAIPAINIPWWNMPGQIGEYLGRQMSRPQSLGQRAGYGTLSTKEQELLAQILNANSIASIAPNVVQAGVAATDILAHGQVAAAYLQRAATLQEYIKRNRDKAPEPKGRFTDTRMIGYAQGGLVSEMSGLYQSRLKAQQELKTNADKWFVSPLLNAKTTDTKSILDSKGNTVKSNELLTLDDSELAVMYGKNESVLKKQAKAKYPWFDDSKYGLIRGRAIYSAQQQNFTKQDDALKLIDELAYEFKAMPYAFEMKNNQAYTDQKLDPNNLINNLKDTTGQYDQTRTKQVASLLANRQNFLNVLYSNLEEGSDIISKYITDNGRDDTLRSAFKGVDPDSIMESQKTAVTSELNNIFNIMKDSTIQQYAKGVKNNFNKSRVLNLANAPKPLQMIFDYFKNKPIKKKEEDKTKSPTPKGEDTPKPQVGNKTKPIVLADFPTLDSLINYKFPIESKSSDPARFFPSGDKLEWASIKQAKDGGSYTVSPDKFKEEDQLAYALISKLKQEQLFTDDGKGTVSIYNPILSQVLRDRLLPSLGYSITGDGDEVRLNKQGTRIWPPVNAVGKQRGGMIYASEGQYINFQPKGTDTVPAMLTPGEFVVNARSTKENLGLLQDINSRQYSTGGIVYAQNGRLIGKPKKLRKQPSQRDLNDAYSLDLAHNWAYRGDQWTKQNNPDQYDKNIEAVERDIRTFKFTSMGLAADKIFTKLGSSLKDLQSKAKDPSVYDSLSFAQDLTQQLYDILVDNDPDAGSRAQSKYASMRKMQLNSIQRSKINLADGGIVYAAKGHMVQYSPKGTDTVPAMLTPGEFVVNKQATQQNLPLLKQINSRGYQNGGIVRYYQNGSDAPVPNGKAGVGSMYSLSLDDKSISLMRDFTSKFAEFSTRLANLTLPSLKIDDNTLSSLNNFTKRFDDFAKELLKLNLPPVITITGKHDVNVNINGASVFSSMDKYVSNMIKNEINNAFAQLARETDGAIAMNYNPSAYSNQNTKNIG